MFQHDRRLPLEANFMFFFAVADCNSSLEGTRKWFVQSHWKRFLLIFSEFITPWIIELARLWLCNYSVIKAIDGSTSKARRLIFMITVIRVVIATSVLLSKRFWWIHCSHEGINYNVATSTHAQVPKVGSARNILGESLIKVKILWNDISHRAENIFEKL